jgi:hypothetical protein
MTGHQRGPDEDDKTDSEAESEAGDNGGLREVVEETMEAVVEPVKPLRLLMPRRNEETGSPPLSPASLSASESVLSSSSALCTVSGW